jgi:hypothetical protein
MAPINPQNMKSTADYPTMPAAPGPAGRYRAVHWAAVTSLALGALSALVWLDWPFLLLPLAAVLLGWRALGRIARTSEEFTGASLAWTGIALAVVFGISGVVSLLVVRAGKVPPGYRRTEYIELQPNPRDPQQKIPESVLKLEGTKVFIKGFMIPGRQQVRLKKFLICPTNGECTFHPPNPRRTEILKVQLTGDLMADYTREPLSLGGRFHVDANERLPYAMDADFLR